MSDSRTPIERFMNFIEIDRNTHCWNWIGTIHRSGYGQFGLNGRNIAAHRAALILIRNHEFTKDIKDEQCDHLCRNRACVNPDHLDLVTAKENSARSPIAQQALNRMKTHCKRGHEFTVENTVLNGKGRGCRECRRQWKRAWRATPKGERKRQETSRRKYAENGAEIREKLAAYRATPEGKRKHREREARRRRELN